METPIKKRVAIYARVSTADQTPENQLRDLREYCQRRDWVVKREFVDLGISGTTESRTALNDLMHMVRTHHCDAVVVWRFDRFARSVRHLVMALDEMRANHVDFISFQESVDTSSPQGRMMFSIIAAIAEFERSIIVDRTKAGLRRAVAEGKKLGRPVVPDFKVQQVLDIRASHPDWSWTQVGEESGLNKSVAWKVCKRFQIPPPEVQLTLVDACVGS